MSVIRLIAWREYLENIRTKGFWLGILLLRTGSPLGWPVLVLLAVQLLLGILNVLLALPLSNATLHNGFGAVLLLALVTVNYRAYLGGMRS